MWRWMIRIYVAFVVFAFLMFISGVLLIRVDRLLITVGYPGFSRAVHEHVLFTMFLLGFVVGQLYLESNFTGRGWFRSKSGLTYEGFKLEALKPWTWIIAGPILLLGTFLWFYEQSESGVMSDLSPGRFYHDFLMPNCSNAPLVGFPGDLTCFMHLLFVGTWVASIGYSLAPTVRRNALVMLRISGDKSSPGDMADTR
jgi:hypothetical protein